MKKAVIFGAGQTGRGYTARYLVEKGYSICFLDKKTDLVERLKQDKKFIIHFYNKDRSPFEVANFSTYHIDEDLTTVLSTADIIFTAVAEENLKEVAKTIYKNLSSETSLPQIVTCENGINPGKVLAEELSTLFDKEITNVSQTAVFCSTIFLKETRLDIMSQNMTYFPYDTDHFIGQLDLNGSEAVHDFESFLKRKIYTYNCFAGIISYLGYIKNYKIFSEAANDPEILALIAQLQEVLNPSLAEYFNISLEEQTAFSEQAMIKFKDKNIIDFVIKNGRAAKRKLGATERIFAPYKIIQESSMDTEVLPLVGAAALIYWQDLQEISEPKMPDTPEAVLRDILRDQPADKFIEKTLNYYSLLSANRDNTDLMKVMTEGETV